MSAIRTENLSKSYGPVQALDGLTLSVPEGIVFGFLGPNGAGKSTTIRLLTGLAKPSAGQGWIAGEPITDGSRLARKIGYLPEEPAFYTWMTPVEFLDHVARLFDLPAAKRRERVGTLLEEVGLAEAGKRRIAGFSRGMRQRLGLAQALINRPEVLLLDEPASALDPAGRKEVLDMIGALRNQCTVFMSTHILADVERVCDRIAIIDRGRLVVEARQAELLERYSLPVYELECLAGYEEPFAAWVHSLAELPWSERVTVEGGLARIEVNDVEQANQALLRLAAGTGITLRRFEMVRPSLEDIFLRLVEPGKERRA
jgi:ABC-2 type transport system ATP-binding protein